MATTDHLEPTLEWVLIDGAPRHVSDFAGTAPKDRPDATCPGCGRPVTMKLGDIKMHHAAHQPGSGCVLSSGETALHMNTKLYLASKLERAASIIVNERCSKRNDGLPCRCEGCRTRTWDIPAWDAVAVEYAVGSRRPDITLLASGSPVAAIEVFVTHRVDEDKSSDLLFAGLPWIEVDARTVSRSGEDAWDSGYPLEVDRFDSDEPWVCDSHATYAREEAERLKRLKLREAARRRAAAEEAARVEEYKQRLAEEKKKSDELHARRYEEYLKELEERRQARANRIRERYWQEKTVTLRSSERVTSVVLEMITVIKGDRVSSAYVYSAWDGIICRADADESLPTPRERRDKLFAELDTGFRAWIEQMKGRGNQVASETSWESLLP